ncbi:MAG: phosphopantetheine-binding protein [Acidimicrobiia bacterium]|nr:phosphopantetheine-binding protein [Acidimicrobiia bacterium]
MDATETATIEALEGFVRSYGQVAPDDPDFGRSTNLWEEGYLDSAGVVELLAFVEEHFGVTVPDEALFLPEFTTLDGMAEVVDRLLAGEPVV